MTAAEIAEKLERPTRGVPRKLNALKEAA